MSANIDLGQTPEVDRWFKAAGHDRLPAAEQQQLLSELAAFCQFTGKSPSELPASCLRITNDGQKAISAKGRTAMQATIEAFVHKELGLAGHQAIVAGNRLRGFLIHNGVFIQGPASIR